MNAILFSFRRIMVLTLFVLLTVSQLHFTQAPDTAWTKLYMPAGFFGMPAPTMFYSGHQTPDGGFIAVGMTTNPWVKAYIVRTDGNGDTLWTKQYFEDIATYQSFVCPSIQLTSDGGYILSGYTTSGTILLLKLNSVGDSLWCGSYGCHTSDSLYVVEEVKVTSDNGYIVIGTVGTIFDTDVFVLKTDVNGNQQWYCSYSLSDYYDRGYSIVSSHNNDGYLFSGLTNVPDTVFVMKINLAGSILWTNHYPLEDQPDEFQQLIKTSDGNYVLAGANANFYLYKLDETGTVLNFAEFGNFSGGQYFEEDCNSVYQTNDGGYVMCGHSDIIFDLDYELWVVKTDANFTEQWSRIVQASSNAHTTPYIEQTTNGDYIIFSSTRLDPSGANYGLMIRLGTGASDVSDDENLFNDFVLNQNYPNPFNPSTTIEFTLPQTEFVSLKIYDVLGNEVAVVSEGIMSAGSYKINWNAANISSGVYFYRLKANNISETKKLILNK